MSGYGCFVDPQRGVWLKTYYYSCKLVAFLLAGNEKKGILDFIYLIQPRANRNIAHLCCIWLYCWLPIWGFIMWWCCLCPFFMRPNCKWSALVSGDKVVANLKGKTSWDRFNCWSLLLRSVVHLSWFKWKIFSFY